MTILITGATGTVGRQVVEQLVQREVPVRALVRQPDQANLPAEVEVIAGDLLDPVSVRAALAGVDTLFLLNAVAADELTQAMQTLSLARELGVRDVVYLSVFGSDRYVNVPHFASKYLVERMLEAQGFAATVLRPAYFINNDAMQLAAVQEYGVYGMPIGELGLAMIDARDIAEIAALELIRRSSATESLPYEVINLVGPDTLTGAQVTAIWQEESGRDLAYGGDDTAMLERQLQQFGPAWLAYDMRLMADGFQQHGMVPEEGDVERLETRLQRPLRSYRAFVREVLQS